MVWYVPVSEEKKYFGEVIMYEYEYEYEKPTIFFELSECNWIS